MLQTQSDPHCTLSVAEALEELNRVAPHAPLLALGQTIFWDEPMKAGIALKDRKRKLVAGIHDTDYFAKLPSGTHKAGEFQAVPHNDTTTRGLWSAAAEFSRLFGSETVITKEALTSAGLKLEKISQGRPHFLDDATQAWGWKGIVSLDEDPPITADVKISNLYPELKQTIDWAIDMSLQSVCEPQQLVARERSDYLKSIIQRAYDDGPDAGLAEFYKKILPSLYQLVSGTDIEVEATKTTELLKFNKSTCAQPRFDLVNLFVSPESADQARKSYDDALKGSEIYTLDRFGTGAIPFDLVIPGKGRGTIRIAPRSVVIMAHEPVFISLKSPLRHVQDLAEAISSKLGQDCVLIGKAVTLIGMLAREFVFVFHEGASSYVKHTVKFHEKLEQQGIGLKMNPILRVRLNAWDALAECSTWIHLPEHFQGPFGTEELTSESFSARWKEVAAEQKQLLADLGQLKRPLGLISFLAEKSGGSWQCLAREYNSIHGRLEQVEKQIDDLKKLRRVAYAELQQLKKARIEAEKKKGDHFRSEIFENNPSQEQLDKRKRLAEEVEAMIHLIAAKKKEIRTLLQKQSDFVGAPEIRAIHERRRAIEVEAELKRLRLIRQAVITSKGLCKASNRPSAWWYPLVCPDGGWFRTTIDTAECYLEHI
ncbi:MAG TPA: hypothetical protein VGL56_10240 [Fimbriimonadaceae bacterium]